MGKISNQTKYPLDAILTGSEFLIGTDVDNRTRTFSVDQIAAYVEAGITAAEIKALYESNADTNAFTDALRDKLIAAEDNKFLGTYISLNALETANPSPTEGSYGYVDTGVGTDVNMYIWDNDDNSFVLSTGQGVADDAATIKVKYESNADTNAFTDLDVSKLADGDKGEVTISGTTWTIDDKSLQARDLAIDAGSVVERFFTVTGGAQLGIRVDSSSVFSVVESVSGDGMIITGGVTRFINQIPRTSVTPTVNDHLTRKGYVDDEITTATTGLQSQLVSGTNIKTVNGQTLLGSGDLDVDTSLSATDQTLSGVDRDIALSSTSSLEVTLDATSLFRVKNATGTNYMTIQGSNSISFPTSIPTVLSDPTSGNELARKSYVDTTVGDYLPLGGGVMTGNIGGGLSELQNFSRLDISDGSTTMISTWSSNVFSISKTGGAPLQYNNTADEWRINGSPILTGATSGSAIEVEDEGVSLTTGVTKFNFVGAGVTVTEPVTNEVLVTIGGGGSSEFLTDISQNTIVGRVSAGSGNSEELTASQVRTLINVEDGATADQTGSEIESSLDTELANVRWKVEEVPSGGTTGQVVRKNSGTDYDISWDDDSVQVVTQAEYDALSPPDADTVYIISDAFVQSVDTSIATSSSGNIDVVGNEGNVYYITLTEDSTLNNPSAPIPNTFYQFNVYQDGVGGWTLSFGSNFKFPDGTAPVVDFNANSKNLITAYYDGTDFLANALINFL